MKHFNKKMAIAMLCTTVMSGFPLSSQAASDIKGHWAEANIAAMQSQGYIGGYSDGNFHPDKQITRAEFVAALNKILGLSGDGELHFSDVKANDWFAKELAVALKHGYIGGYEDGTFRPNQPVSRIEAAVMISRANRLSEKYDASPSDLKEFKDNGSIPNWAKGELAVVVKSGIMRGKLEKFFQGNSKITRAEAVVSLSRAKEVRETLGIQTVAADVQKETAKPNETSKVEPKKAAETKKPASSGGGGGGGFSSHSGGGGSSFGGGGGGSSAPSQPSPSPSPSTPSKPDSNTSSGSGSTGGSSNAGAPSVTPAPPAKEKNPSDENSPNGAGKGTSEPNIPTPPDTAGKDSSESSVPAPPPAENQSDETGEDLSRPNIPPSSPDSTNQGDKTPPNENLPGGTEKDSTTPSPQDPSKDNQSDGQTPEQKTPPSTSNPKKEVGEKTIDELMNELKSGTNENVTHYMKDGKERAIIWTMGITAPTIDENGTSGDFKKLVTGDYVDYLMDYKPGNNWYDVNKKFEQDKVLCSGAVASNMLHWWLHENEKYINRFLESSSSNGVIDNNEEFQEYKDLRNFLNSFKSQTDSKIFQMITRYFGNIKNGIWSDQTINFFINGHRPPSIQQSNKLGLKDEKGGFLYPVFEGTRLTDKTYARKYSHLHRMIREWMMDGRALAISYVGTGNPHGHIYSIWGAEFDLSGQLTAIFISDSDDTNTPTHAMKRLVIKYQSKDGDTRISSNLKDPNHGPLVHELYSLSLGTEQWEQYFEKQKQNQTP
ncbi:MAG: IdeS/Mac family cysteine endopeptidase [Peptostreptococcaceae bacterium]|nr:IdeS/Mac family cysteine endopeptidase [Peptostreptococcaceae bacterium]